MVNLNEVFGVNTSIPQHTYVDRASLDEQFKYLIGTERHIVIHGSSKQGKTVLRKKNLPEKDSVIVRCRYNATIETIYQDILRQLNINIPTEITKSLSVGAEGKGKVSGQAKIPLLPSWLGSVSVEGEGGGNIEKGSETVCEPVGLSSDCLGYVTEQIRKSKKRVIIEDLHYLPDEEKVRLAFDLKALWDDSIFFIIIGVWAEQNLLTYYNGDLSGRVSEIDIQWTDEELKEVIIKGEIALNISIENAIKDGILSDASGNVGLLQRLAEKYCYHAGIFKKQTALKNVIDLDALTKGREAICTEESVRYRQFIESISHGFKGSESSELKVYQRIVRVCLEASNEELCNGLHYDVILDRIQKLESRIRPSDLTAALKRLDKLQANRQISPLILSYNHNLRQVQLVDRELLFYRQYGNPNWHWEETENG